MQIAGLDFILYRKVLWETDLRIHRGALSCSFTRWGPTGLRELICFTACFVDCIWPDVPLCGLPKQCGSEGTPSYTWNSSQEAWCCTAFALDQPPPWLSGSKTVFQTEGSDLFLRPLLRSSIRYKPMTASLMPHKLLLRQETSFKTGAQLQIHYKHWNGYSPKWPWKVGHM